MKLYTRNADVSTHTEVTGSIYKAANDAREQLRLTGTDYYVEICENAPSREAEKEADDRLKMELFDFLISVLEVKSRVHLAPSAGMPLDAAALVAVLEDVKKADAFRQLRHEIHMISNDDQSISLINGKISTQPIPKTPTDRVMQKIATYVQEHPVTWVHSVHPDPDATKPSAELHVAKFIMNNTRLKLTVGLQNGPISETNMPLVLGTFIESNEVLKFPQALANIVHAAATAERVTLT